MLIAIGFLCAGVWILARQHLPEGLWAPDGYEYADMARRLARGDGFTTGVVFPAQLHFGAADHPALTRPPLWPLLLAAVFTLTGPVASAVHATTGALLVASGVLAAALATRLGGRGAGLVTGVAVASSPQLLAFTMGALAEPLFGVVLLLTFALWRFGAAPVWIGAACGLAYLTRYNGAFLLPVMLALLATRSVTGSASPFAASPFATSPFRRGRALLLCGAGFLAVAAPWWIRNTLVAGDPFYSLLNFNPYMAPSVRGLHSSLIYFLEPDLESPAAIAPWEKFVRQLPLLLRYFPLASANLAAFAGVVWACARGSRSSWAFAALALATTAVAAFALPLGRYYVPMLPLLLALGAAGWLRFGGRAAVPALMLLLAAPWLPHFPAEAPDLTLARSEIAATRERVRENPDAANSEQNRRAALRRCIEPGAMVLAEQAPRVAWHTDATALYLPASDAELWTVVEREPVAFVQIERWQDTDRKHFAERFAPRPECAPDLYASRRDPDVR